MLAGVQTRPDAPDKSQSARQKLAE
jgi:hypothetical protein